MTQLEILKYAYVGALETVEGIRDLKKKMEKEKETMQKRLAKEALEKRLTDADRDFEEIRDMMFAEISKESGIDFEEDTEAAAASFKVVMEAGSVKQNYLRGLTEREAEHVCENNGWTYTDENGFVWSLDYEPEEVG